MASDHAVLACTCVPTSAALWHATMCDWLLGALQTCRSRACGELGEYHTKGAGGRCCTCCWYWCALDGGTLCCCCCTLLLACSSRSASCSHQVWRSVRVQQTDAYGGSWVCCGKALPQRFVAMLLQLLYNMLAELRCRGETIARLLMWPESLGGH